MLTLILQERRRTEEKHYFRNKLNRVPETYQELLENKDDWELLDVKAAVYHMNEFGDDSGLYNAKFISKEGNYEAVYNIITGELVTDYINMGTFNFSGNYGQGTTFERAVKSANQFTLDMAPYYKWGNTDDKNTAEQIWARFVSSNGDRYKKESETNEEFKKSWDNFLKDWE